MSTLLYPVLKALISGLLIMAASELAKRSPVFGALIVSLPLISLLTFVWLWRDTGDVERIASLSESTFWFVLLTLPSFLVLPLLLRHGLGFWMALALAVLLTMLLYGLTLAFAGRLGIRL